MVNRVGPSYVLSLNLNTISRSSCHGAVNDPDILRVIRNRDTMTILIKIYSHINNAVNIKTVKHDVVHHI